MESMRRPGGRSARVRAAVLEAAVLELGEFGWRSLSVDRIATRSGVHKTTIYRRWGSADRVVLEALLERGSEGIPIPDTGDLSEDLVRLGRSVAAGITDPIGRALAAAIISEPDSPTIRRLAEAFWSQRFEAARSIVDRAIERGDLAASTDAGRVVETVAAQVWFRVMMRRDAVTDAWLNEIVDSVVEGWSRRSE
jgi:AcrR family transcriptional regulator